MKKIEFLIYIIFLSAYSFAQNKSVKYKGIFKDSVAVKNVVGESYAIYLPENYDRNKQSLSSIIFIFDPAARGKIGIAPFMLGADTYNYILVCSNNSKNGSIDKNIAIAQRLFDSVLNEYAINSSRFYIAGFSGGARLAGSIALSSGVFQGIIACGASFAASDKLMIAQNNFSYVGFVGEKDMNYQEMIANRAWLQKSNIKNELFIFDGDHNWPRPAQILRGFDWLELQAYQKNSKKSDDNIIKKLCKKNVVYADSLKNANKYILAVNEYERINTNFNSKFISDTINQHLVALKKSKEYKAELKKSEELAIVEIKITEKFLKRFEEDIKSKSDIDFAFWRKELKNLKEISARSNDELTHYMVSRLQNLLRALANEKAAFYKTTGDALKKEYCTKLLEVINSE
jgi:dienelactone hydrolase